MSVSALLEVLGTRLLASDAPATAETSADGEDELTQLIAAARRLDAKRRRRTRS